MAIEYELIGSPSGVARSSTQDADWKRTYVQHWRAITDNPLIGPGEVRANAPVAIGQTYNAGTESDSGSYCQQIAVSEDTTADDGCQWIISAQYGPFDVMSQAPEVPFTQRPKLSFGFSEFQQVQTVDANGDAILNSAGDPFNPPLMEDVSWPIMTITRNEPGFNLGLVATAKGKINALPWFGRPAKWWRCLNIAGDEAQDPDGAIYFVVTYQFALNPNEWTAEVLDQGMRELNSNGERVAILDKYGNKVTEPWPLNEDGTKKAVGEDPEFLVFDVIESIDYSVFDLDTFYNEEVAAGRLI